MRKRTLISFMYFMSIFMVYSQSFLPKMVFLPVENNTENAIYDVVIDAINETLDFSFRMLGAYEFINTQNNFEVNNLADGFDFAESERAESILWGEFTLNDEGLVDIALVVFDVESKRMVATFQESVASFIEVFNVSDKMVLDLMSFMGNDKVSFGSVVFSNTGEPGEFEIYFNGQSLGTNVQAIPRIVSGQYQVEVIQNRFGIVLPILNTTLLIEPEQEQILEFSIPHLTGIEESRINHIREKIDSYIQNEVPLEEQEQRLLDLLSTMEDLSFCPSLEADRRELEYDYIRIKMNTAMQQAISDFNHGRTISSELFTGVKIEDLEKDENGISQELKSIIIKIAFLKKVQQLSYLYDHALEIEEVPDISLGDFEKAYTNLFQTILLHDQAYLKKLFSIYILNQHNRNLSSFRVFLNSQYSKIWDLVNDSINGYSDITQASLDDYVFQYTKIDFLTKEIWEGVKPFRYFGEIGGGALAQGGIQWRPFMSFINIKAGIAGSIQVDPVTYASLPVELDYCLGKERFVFRVGFTVDALSYVLDRSQDLYVLDYFNTPGFVCGLDLQIKGVYLQFSNYLYFSDDGLMYSPALGVSL